MQGTEVCWYGERRETPWYKLLDQGSSCLIGVKPHGEESGVCIAHAHTHTHSHTAEKCIHTCRVTACQNFITTTLNMQGALAQTYKHTETFACGDMQTYTAGEGHRSIALSMLISGKGGVRQGEAELEMSRGYSHSNTSGNSKRKTKPTRSFLTITSRLLILETNNREAE